MTAKPTTCVIGAGISGLTTGKAFSDWGLPYTCFEASDDIGGNWYFGNPNANFANQNGGAFWDYRNRLPAGHTGGVSDWDNVTGAPVVTNGRLVTNNSSAKREYNGPGEGGRWRLKSPGRRGFGGGRDGSRSEGRRRPR